MTPTEQADTDSIQARLDAATPGEFVTCRCTDIAALLAKVKRLEGVVEKLNTPDFYWPDDCPESPVDDVRDETDEVSVGECVILHGAKGLDFEVYQNRGADQDDQTIDPLLVGKFKTRPEAQAAKDKAEAATPTPQEDTSHE